MILFRALVALLWGSANWVTRRLRRGHRLGVRTVSVGNLQAGGAGKTPLVMEIARQAVSRGKVVCVLSRGYGGRVEREQGEAILRPGELADPGRVGDEVALIRSKVPEVWIAVGQDRIRAFKRALSLSRALGQPIDLAILDDGFQHWRIQADLQILAVTSADWRKHWFREFASEARRADLIVWTKGEIRPSGRVDVKISWASQVEKVSGPFHLVTAVADPDEVETSLVRAGVQIGKHSRFADHHSYSLDECLSLLSAPDPVLLTEKDAVKWSALGVAPSRFSVIGRALVWDSGRAEWDRKLWSE